MAVCREQWLNAAVKALRPRFTAVGHTLPERIQVSVGYEKAADGARAISHLECKSGVGHIFIAHHEKDAVAVLGYLLHELTHLAADEYAGAVVRHGPAFVHVYKEIGMNAKKPLVSHFGWGTKKEMKILAERLGPYPHIAVG